MGLLSTLKIGLKNCLLHLPKSSYFLARRYVELCSISSCIIKNFQLNKHTTLWLFRHNNWVVIGTREHLLVTKKYVVPIRGASINHLSQFLNSF